MTANIDNIKRISVCTCQKHNLTKLGAVSKQRVKLHCAHFCEKLATHAYIS